MKTVIATEATLKWKLNLLYHTVPSLLAIKALNAGNQKLVTLFDLLIRTYGHSSCGHLYLTGPWTLQGTQRTSFGQNISLSHSLDFLQWIPGYSQTTFFWYVLFIHVFWKFTLEVKELVLLPEAFGKGQKKPWPSHPQELEESLCSRLYLLVFS